MGKRVNLGEAVMATIADVKQWIVRDLPGYVRIGESVPDRRDWDTVESNPYIQIQEEGPGVFRFRIYTETNWYSVSARESGPKSTMPSEIRPSYMGCIAKCRKPRAGEEVHRGSDLPDGPLEEETWKRILAAIVSYEMVRIFKNRVKGVPEKMVRETKSGDRARFRQPA